MATTTTTMGTGIRFTHGTFTSGTAMSSVSETMPMARISGFRLMTLAGTCARSSRGSPGSGLAPSSVWICLEMMNETC